MKLFLEMMESGRVQKGQVRMISDSHIFPFPSLFHSIICFSSWSSPNLRDKGVTTFSGYIIRRSLWSALRSRENKEDSFTSYILALSLDSVPFWAEQ